MSTITFVLNQLEHFAGETELTEPNGSDNTFVYFDSRLHWSSILTNKSINLTWSVKQSIDIKHRDTHIV